MAWLFLVLALGALWMAFTAATTGGLVFALLVALAMFAAFVLKLASDRIGSRARDEQLILDPEELRRLREQAEARRLAAATQNEPPRG
ncbi:membrane glycosyltransferase [Lysobacter niabensis]|jgi:membrane glycosyltransferase|uniref:Membrane glycosyltransferase n=1 Tax=Agrilutibacter niabensis TaxID=380628 RepID=A0ABU1VRW7_9GAMM|nr:hypothetical protein [Lysobacter niabensis]MDR7100229.1 membrane glycosyltransferase [Lysobacter niabensis]